MPSSVTIAAPDFRFVISLDRYEFALEPGMSVEDANWIVGNAELEVGQFRGHQDVTIRPIELMGFRNELLALLETKTGTAELNHLEEEVQVTVRLKKGNGTISGRLRNGLVELTFEGIKTDQSLLTAMVDDLTGATEEFPPRLH